MFIFYLSSLMTIFFCIYLFTAKNFFENTSADRYGSKESGYTYKNYNTPQQIEHQSISGPDSNERHSPLDRPVCVFVEELLFFKLK